MKAYPDEDQYKEFRVLLESSCEDFLPIAYETILGRPIDYFGAIIYALKLQRGFTRDVILAELRSSPEGVSRAVMLPWPNLDRVVVRYNVIKALPIGKYRWRLLPKLFSRNFGDQGFDWIGWVNSYTNHPLPIAFNHANRHDIVDDSNIDYKNILDKLDQLSLQINFIRKHIPLSNIRTNDQNTLALKSIVKNYENFSCLPTKCQSIILETSL